MLENEQTLRTLAELILVNRSSERGFQACTRLAEDGACRALLAANASRRGAAACELEQVAHALGAAPEDATRGIVVGRRGWLEFPFLPTGVDDATLLARCEHAEGHVLEVYRNALDDVLPDELRSVLQQQFEGVIDDHERLVSLQHARTLAARMAVARTAPVALLRSAGNG